MCNTSACMPSSCGASAARAEATEPTGRCASLSDQPTADPASGSPTLGFLASELLSSSAWLTSPKTLVAAVLGGLLTYFALVVTSLIFTRRPGHGTPSGNGSRTAADSHAPLGEQREPGASVRRTQIGGLAAQRQTRWSAGTNDGSNSAVEIGKSYDLASGSVELRLDGGVRVVLDGPAQWQFSSDQRLLLNNGKLAAHVPMNKVGFTVVTPSTEVIDLGTDFTLVVKSDGDSALAVSKSAVQLLVRAGNDRAAQAGPKPIRVSAGQAMTVLRMPSGATVARSAPFAENWNSELASACTAGISVSRLIEFQVLPERVPGKDMRFRGSAGIDFDVTRPVRVTQLGVFDHLGDGIDADSELTVQLSAARAPRNVVQRR